MLDSVIKLIIGDLGEKKEYKNLVKRVDALPKEYRLAFKKIQNYMYTVGSPHGDLVMFTDLTMFTNLVELFEESAAEGKGVLEVIGSDVSKFVDEYMNAYSSDSETIRQKINREIKQHFGKEGKWL